jgi:hypothetical protein
LSCEIDAVVAPKKFKAALSFMMRGQLQTFDG